MRITTILESTQYLATIHRQKLKSRGSMIILKGVDLSKDNGRKATDLQVFAPMTAKLPDVQYRSGYSNGLLVWRENLIPLHVQ